MGIGLREAYDAYYKANGLTPAQVLTTLDAWKNELADSRGLAHTDVASAHLYPSTFVIWLSLTDPHNHAQAPAPQGGAFPYVELMDGLRDRGVTPLIFWQPIGPEWPNGGFDASDALLAKWDPSVSTWQNWTNGSYDEYLDQFATSAKSWAVNDNSGGLTSQGNAKSSEIIFRLAHEHNTNFFGWSTSGHSQTLNTPTKFINGFRHIHDRLRVYNAATNLMIHFCPWPNNGSAIDTIKEIYPGDNYCQYLGVDLYAGSLTSTAWAPDLVAPIVKTDGVPSLRAAMSQVYLDLTALGTQPIILGETGVLAGNSHFTPTDAQRKSWFTGTSWTGSGGAGGYTDASTRYPNLRNITWFNPSTVWYITKPASPYGGDWPLTYAAYATLADTFSSRMPGVTVASLKEALPISPYSF